MFLCRAYALIWSTAALIATNAFAQAEDKYVLAPVVVQASSAGQFTTGSGAAAVLKPLEILSTPGSAADINRALQTLPGVQAADEGNALFVRGGDSRETATWINGVKFPGSAELNAPLGTFTGSVSPWQTSSVEFAAGGFGASTGDVLSGAVKVKTNGAPRSRGASLNLGVGNFGLALFSPFGSHAGGSINATRTDLSTFFDMFSPAREFAEPPHGYEVSVAGSWDVSTEAKVKWFGIGQHNQLGLQVDDRGRPGLYRVRSDTQFGVVALEGRSGAWKHEMSIGAGTTDKDERIDLSQWTTAQRSQQLVYAATLDVGSSLWRFGYDLRREQTAFERISAEPPDSGEPQRFSAGLPETQAAAWVEWETLVGPRVRLVSGLRAWRSRRADQERAEPRVALTWQPDRRFAASLAGGVYHQIPEGIYYKEGFGRWPAMRTEQAIASVEWKRGTRLFRVEAYEKRSTRLVAMGRDYVPHGGGEGRARGVDFIGKLALPGDVNARVTWSFVNAARTDPNTGLKAPAPWAVPHSVSLIVDRACGNWKVSLAGRWAMGRAFTPIIGCTRGASGENPVYGEPNSERLPSFRRVDCTLTRMWEISERWTAVSYLAGFNLFGWKNVQSYAYSADYAERRVVPGLFSRSVYFGVNLIYR